jgi:outer membrane protein assembly factor BamB
VGTFANELVEVNIDSQKVTNRYTTRGWVWGRPVLFDNRLYFGDLAGYVTCVDATTLKRVWESNDSAHPGGIRGRVAIANNSKGRPVVFAGSESKYMMAFNADDGSSAWGTAGISAIQADDQILSDVLVIGKDVISTTQSDAQILIAFNVDDGAKQWSVNLTSERGRFDNKTVTPLPIPTGFAPTPTTAPNPLAGTPAATANATSAATASSQ